MVLGADLLELQWKQQLFRRSNLVTQFLFEYTSEFTAPQSRQISVSLFLSQFKPMDERDGALTNSSFGVKSRMECVFCGENGGYELGALGDESDLVN